jgi:hypothetical protein
MATTHYEGCNCCGCCGCYSVALILTGDPVNFSIIYTAGGHASAPAYHGKTGFSPIVDPATPGCETRVLWFPCTSPTEPCNSTYAALQAEFGEDCVTDTGLSYFGLPPWPYDPTPQPEDYPNWGPLDCTATGGLIVGLSATFGDIIGATARVYKSCSSCSLVGTIEFPAITSGNYYTAEVPQSCCCKCCDAYAFGGLIGYFAEWDCVSDCVEPFTDECCENYCGQTKRVKILQSPYDGAEPGSQVGSCQWIDDEGYYHFFGQGSSIDYLLGGECDLGDGVWNIDTNNTFGCRTGPNDTSPAVIPFGGVGFCGTGSVTCTPVAESWTSCYAPIPDLTGMPLRALSSPTPVEAAPVAPVTPTAKQAKVEALRNRVRKGAAGVRKKCGCKG